MNLNKWLGFRKYLENTIRACILGNSMLLQRFTQYASDKIKRFISSQLCRFKGMALASA